MRGTAFTLSCMLEAMNSSLLAIDMLNYKFLCMRSFVSTVLNFQVFTFFVYSKPPSPRDMELTSAIRKRVSSLPFVYTGHPAFEISIPVACDWAAD